MAPPQRGDKKPVEGTVPMNEILFPFATYWWFYLAFTILILLLLAVDLFAHRRTHVMSLRASAAWCVFWVVLALVFCFFMYFLAGTRLPPAIARRLCLEFLTGYLVEKSLSVDNIFVFALVFRYFGVESQYQRKVLFYGVVGAILFRGAFIAAGAVLMRFEWVAVAFGVFLVVTGARMAFGPETQIDPGANPVVRLARRLVPVTPGLHGHRFVVRVGGIPHLTPLMIVLLVLETTDVLFAVDSVPAVFAVTSEPLIVFTSNVFAILGLRALYFLLAGAMDRFHALKYGLAAVLVFVGVKMAVLDQLSEDRFPASVSLAVIIVTLGVSVALSFVRPRWDVLVRRVAGAACMALSAAALVVTFGTEAEVVAAVGPVPLSVSAGCYAVCGWLLVRGGKRLSK